MAQYRASKIASYKAVLGFAAERKPAFDVITLHPVYVFGRSLIQSSPAELDGTNRMLFNSLLARTPSTGQFLGVHVEDVALAHIRVLEDDICGVQPYLLSAPRRSWQDVRSFVVDEFPGFEMGLEKNVEDWENWEADTTRATRDLKIIFRPMEDQVRDLVSQQLELRS
jgi:nucleoside-diphosphate-sugar epimerase